MEGTPNTRLESLYHETNRQISQTHASLAELNNQMYFTGGWNTNEASNQNQAITIRKIEASINNVFR